MARLFMAGSCILAAVAALRRAGQRADTTFGLRALLGLVAALLGIGAALALHDAWRNLVVIAPERAIDLGTWLWLVFDLAVPLLALRMLRVLRERDALLAQLAAMSETDPLTGLANRRGFEARALPALAAARRAGAASAFLLFDLDRFKAINDGHGHPAGDAVLRATAQALAAALRSQDVLGRLGGEEFGVLLPNTSAEGAATLAEKLRLAVRETVPHPAPGRVVTISGGLALLGGGSAAATLQQALAAADAALYAAKRGGRDRIAVAGDDKQAGDMA